MSEANSDLDLEIIDQAFGWDADLHKDVLRVSPRATSAEVQHAFFERRKEIYRILNQIRDSDRDFLPQKRFAERRMDGIILAFRILMDTDLKETYERKRQERTQPRAHADQPIRPIPRSSTALLTKDTNKGMGSDVSYSVSGASKPQKLNHSSRRFKPIQSIPSDDAVKRQVERVSSTDTVKISIVREDPEAHKSTRNRGDKINIRALQPPSHKGMPSTSTRAQDIKRKDSESSYQRSYSEDAGDDFSIATTGTAISTYHTGGGILSRIRESKIIKTVAEEVHGTYLDTYSAFDQVFNAFTLQEKEINAVCRRIEKAKYQFSMRHV